MTLREISMADWLVPEAVTEIGTTDTVTRRDQTQVDVKTCRLPVEEAAVAEAVEDQTTSSETHTDSALSSWNPSGLMVL